MYTTKCICKIQDLCCYSCQVANTLPIYGTPAAPNVDLSASLIALEAPNSLSLDLILIGEKDLEAFGFAGSAWLVSARAGSWLNITSIVTKDAVITGGGILRAISSSISANSIDLRGLSVARGNVQDLPRPTDAVVQLQAIMGPVDLPVGSIAWLEAANTALLTSAAAIDSRVTVSNVTM